LSSSPPIWCTRRTLRNSWPIARANFRGCSRMGGIRRIRC
jgi:hypothetical protein